MYIRPMIPLNSVAKPNASSQDFGTLRLAKSHHVPRPMPFGKSGRCRVLAKRPDVATERYANHPSPPSCLIKADNSVEGGEVETGSRRWREPNSGLGWVGLGWVG
jgi:hypothetical protein